jgi:arylsulfatase A-like enzyme
MLFKTLVICLIPLSVYTQQRPNIIYIMSDDHDADAISAYNKTLINTPNIDRLAKEGLRFTRSFVANSICSPVRATLLTGQHSHKNGVLNNRIRFDSSKITLPKLFQQAGYHTGLIGKWHLHSLPTGFDHWKIYPGQGTYYNPRLIHMNNDTVRYMGYSTKVITDQALDYLMWRRKGGKPFFLMVHHKAPHRNFVPEPKYADSFSKKIFPEPATLYDDTTGKGAAYRHQRMHILRDMNLCTDLKIDPVFINDIPHLKPDPQEIRNYEIFINSIPQAQRDSLKTIYAERGRILQQQKPSGNELLKLKYQWYMQDYLACVASIDESVGALLNYLDALGLAEHTIVIYTADQGFYLGENGWFDKRFMYDVSMQTPLLMRWTGRIKSDKSDALVQNIDLAPTMLDLAGINIPSFMQGLSLKPIVTGSKSVLPRKELYYHYYEYPIDHYVLPHMGIREDRYKLIYFYTVDEWEFYDLSKDPRELKNLIAEPGYKAEVDRMKKRLAEVRRKYEDTEPAGTLQ